MEIQESLQNYPQLQALLARFSVDSQTAARVLNFYKTFVQAQLPSQHLDTDVLAKCALLAGTKSGNFQFVNEAAQSPVSFSTRSILRDSNMTAIFTKLKELLWLVEDNISSQLKLMIDDFAFSNKFHQKFLEIWKAIGFNESNDQLKELVWLIFIYGKGKLANRNSDIIYNAQLLQQVFNLLLNKLPNKLQNLNTEETHRMIAQMLSIESSQPDENQIERLLYKTHEKGYFKFCDSIGIQETFSKYRWISMNIRLLGELYQKQLKSHLIDERDFFNNRIKVVTPVKPQKQLTPFARQQNSLKSCRMISWNQDVQMDMQLNQTIRQQNQTCIMPTTPISLAMEMGQWLKQLTEDYFDCEIQEMQDFLDSIRERMEHRTKSFVDINFMLPTPAVSPTSNIIQKIKAFYTKITTLANFAPLFKTSLFALSAEIVMFVHNTTLLSFTQLMQFSQASTMQMVNSIHQLLDSPVQLPLSIKRHLNEVIVKLVTSLAWVPGTDSAKALQNLDEGNQEMQQFFKSVLNISAQHLFDMSTSLQVNEQLKEEAWTTLKYILSEKTELLLGRHLDIIVSCCLYSACKQKQPITFKQILSVYHLTYLEDVKLFTQIQLHNSQGDITQFYNNIFLPATKDYLGGRVVQTAPRIQGLAPTSPLKQNLRVPMSHIFISPMASPIKSPFMTPRTRKLYSRESIQPVGNGLRILFDGRDDDNRQARHLIQILDSSEDQNALPLPSFNSKAD